MAIVTVEDIRAEGVTEAEADDDRVQDAIDEATDQVESITGYFFEAQERTYQLDGRDSPILLLPAPIILIDSVTILNPDGSVFDTLTAGEDFVVYNRHLTQRLINPDDRRYPKIELTPSGYSRPGLVNDVFAAGRFSYFPATPMSVEVVGTFGWTDYAAPEEEGGDVIGVTPRRIKRAVRLLVLKLIPRLTDIEAREEQERWRLTGERTREQSYTRKVGGSSGEVGPFTGDPAIDDILIDFMRPPAMGAP